ncbi:MAG TPA: calcium-translocating P-type ATPase, SERCA-type, partial [Armatimonadota bacterium]|nr:calcium-translocating P-type ATPase, SERCA-type [Armatimonadota bacterium]
QDRLQQYGRNELGREEGTSPGRLLFQQLLSPLIYVLFVAAIVSFAVGHAVDAIIILAIVVINTVIGFLQEYRAEKALEALRRLSAPTAAVLRNGQRKEIPAVEVVPGDILLLASGDRIAADARIISGSNIKTEEASLTGESVPVDKSTHPVPVDTPLAERTNIVYAGTTITYGRGEAVVVATGINTEVGKIAREVASVGRESTPLQKKLSIVGQVLGALAVALALLVFVVGMLRGIKFIEIFLFAVASAVSAIPEGLPAVVTVVLAIGLQRMARKNALVRKLPAVETLGSATVICSDKTGTLTKNEMTAQVIYICGHEFVITGEGYAPKGEILADNQPVDVSEYRQLQLTLEAIVLCNDADLRCSNSQCDVAGDPTEIALLTAAAKAGITKSRLNEYMPRIDEIPFDSSRAYMGTLNDAGDRNLVLVKGAPEKIIDMATHVLTDDGIEEITGEIRNDFIQANHRYASQALRVLAVAYKEMPKDKSNIQVEDLQDGIVLLGLVGMIDPPRPEAIEAIRRAKHAGIRVKMVTGDNKVTARAIAETMGILQDGDERVVEGRELSRMTDEDLTRRINDINVFARVEPEHKLRIVTALKKQGEIVAMTGDGVNDAPALKRADIGIAMGITGTDVSKEASEMVLADDNFATIVGAVEEGRIIFGNIKKVVTYLVSTNTGEMLTILATVLAGLPLPLTPVQILWVNLVTDSFPALSLASDPPFEDVLAEPPRDPGARIITKGVIFSILFVAVIMSIGTIGLFYWGLTTQGEEKARTLAFATMAVFQLFNALNVRSPRTSLFDIGPLSNRWLVAAIATAVILQVIAIHVGVVHTWFGTVPLTVIEWVMVIVVSSTVFWASEVRKRLAPDLVD